MPRFFFSSCFQTAVYNKARSILSKNKSVPYEIYNNLGVVQLRQGERRLRCPASQPRSPLFLACWGRGEERGGGPGDCSRVLFLRWSGS